MHKILIYDYASIKSMILYMFCILRYICNRIKLIDK